MSKQIFTLLSVLLITVLVACKGSGTEPSAVSGSPESVTTSETPTPQPVVEDAESQDTLIIDPNAIVIGLDADMSSGSAQAGEAIRRGIVLAVDEVNENGGVLGRPLQLVVKDHRGNPARGIDNIEALAQIDSLVAVVAGLHTPVALAELESVHNNNIIYLVPWAAGTPVIDNGYAPNYAFRVSVRDEYAGGFLIDEALNLGYQRPGLLLEQTGWGRSNEAAMLAALEAHGLTTAGIEWFQWGDDDMSVSIESLTALEADVIMLVANAPEGVVAVQSMAQRPAAGRLPIISHWGITGGQFFQRAETDLSQVDLKFLQTYSFLNPPFPDRAERVVGAYCARFPGCQSAADIFAPAGTAHAYDLVHLLALAIEQAGTTERPIIRDNLEQLGFYEGLLRNYNAPFSAGHHDSLDRTDLTLAHYNEDGIITPIVLERAQ